MSNETVFGKDFLEKMMNALLKIKQFTQRYWFLGIVLLLILFLLIILQQVILSFLSGYY